jgi:hypothetical protein
MFWRICGFIIIFACFSESLRLLRKKVCYRKKERMKFVFRILFCTWRWFRIVFLLAADICHRVEAAQRPNIQNQKSKSNLLASSYSYLRSTSLIHPEKEIIYQLTNSFFFQLGRCYFLFWGIMLHLQRCLINDFFPFFFFFTLSASSGWVPFLFTQFVSQNNLFMDYVCLGHVGNVWLVTVFIVMF